MRPRLKRLRTTLLIVGSLGGAVGCPPGRHAPPDRNPPNEPPEIIPLTEAIAIVNRNIDKVPGALRALGDVDGSFRDASGKRRSFSADGALFYLKPTYFRFDLKKLGERQFQFGSNQTWYWFYNDSEKDYYCGRHGAVDDVPEEMPVRPEQIIDALGLTAIPAPTALANYQFQVQRIAEEFQQVLFLAPSPTGPGVVMYVSKEYWLDAREPRLVRRVIFRDEAGLIEMDAQLKGYEPLSPGGPLLPTSLQAEWPTSQAQLHFKIQKWSLMTDVTPGSPQFATPSACGAP